MKKYRIKIYLTSFFLLMTIGLYAQSAEISGTVLDKNSEPVPFANVILLSPSDSSIVKGNTTGFEGEFKLQLPSTGEYLLKISSIGFKPFFQSISPENSTNLGSITLKSETQVMEAVEIKVQRPQIITHPDKLVLNVEGSTLAQGSSALETLSKSPGVWVDQNGEITLNGQSGVNIMMDGRPVYVSGDELKSMLESMPSENIKEIEIIDNPSAKYDAEGSAVININLKRNTKTGLNGSVFGNYQYNKLQLGQAGFSLNAKHNGLTTYINADAGRGGVIREIDATRDFQSTDFLLSQTATDTRVSNSFNIRAGLDYQIDENNNIGAMYQGYGRDQDIDWNSQNIVRTRTEESEVSAFNYNNRTRMNHTFNVHYTRDFNVKDASLNIDANYINLGGDNNGVFTNEYELSGNISTERLKTFNPSTFNIYSAQADFSMNLDAVSSKLELGSKYSRVNSSNDLTFLQENEGDLEVDPDRSNQFDYTEEISAGYLSVNTKISEKSNLKTGLRIEQTIANGGSSKSQNNVNRDYLSLFPSIYYQYSPSKNYNVNIGYSKRIKRPDYRLMSPVILYTDPYSYIQGNPGLRPQFTHSFSITQTFLQQYNVSLGYDLTNDFIAELPLQDEETNQTVFAIRNFDDVQESYIRLMAPVQITKFWQSNSMLMLINQKFYTQIGDNVEKNDQTMFSASLNNVFSLPNDFTLEVRGNYRSPFAYGLYQMKSMWMVDLGVKKSFFSDKLDVAINATDIFRTRLVRGKTEIGNDVNKLHVYGGDQSIKINLRYKFSLGDTFKSRQKEVELDELKRAGGQ